MSEFTFDNDGLDAQTVVQGHVTIQQAPAAPDHRAIADRHFAARRHEDAARAYRAALEADPDVAHDRYRLALSMVSGLRPHRHHRDTIAAVRAHLSGVRDLPEARALWALIVEDRDLSWRDRAASVLPNVDLVDPERAAEIVDRVPAHEARTWQALRERSLAGSS